MTDTTRRRFLTGIGAMAIGGIAGCIDMSDMGNDMSLYKHDELPNYDRNWDPELEMGLSGARLYTREGAEAHTLDIARYSPGNGEDGGDWFLDIVDLVQYDGPGPSGDGTEPGEHEGEPMSWVQAEHLAEGGTVVFLAAHNDRGSIVSPDAMREEELNDLLPD